MLPQLGGGSIIIWLCFVASGPGQTFHDWQRYEIRIVHAKSTGECHLWSSTENAALCGKTITGHSTKVNC